MKKILLLMCAFIAAHAALCQHQIILSVVGSSGLEASAGNFRVSSTIGEPVIFTATNNVQTLTQGYHQDGRVLISVSAYEPENGMAGLRVFPNPTSGIVQFETETGFTENAQLLVFDQNGRMISQSELPVGELSQTLDFTNFPAGAYALQVRVQERRAVFQIIKHTP